MSQQNLYTYQPLFCKPLYYPGEIIFSRNIDHLQRTLSFRSFNIETDLDLVHQWVNMEYTKAYWRLAWTKDKLCQLYYSIQRNSNGHSYLGLLDGVPICQFDVYRVLADEIQQHVEATEMDCGFHLLMAPNNTPVRGLTVFIVQAYLGYFFSFPDATRMFGEPDIRNSRSNQVLQRAGFTFQQQITMSYKEANLYSITKQQFNANNPFNVFAGKS